MPGIFSYNPLLSYISSLDRNNRNIRNARQIFKLLGKEGTRNFRTPA